MPTVVIQANELTTGSTHLYATSAVYATAQGAATGTPDGWTAAEVGQTFGGGYYSVYRGGLVFDTSSVPSNATIVSATLSLYSTQDNSNTDFGLTIVSGADLADNFVDADYGGLLNDITSFGALSTASWVLSAWNIITLNATGLAAITKAGTTRFGLRSSRDISVTIPTGLESVTFYGHGGDANRPKLTITYTPTYPTLAISRVTGLIHRYDRRKGDYLLEMAIGDVTSDYGMPTPERFIPGQTVLSKKPPRVMLPGQAEEELLESSVVRQQQSIVEQIQKQREQAGAYTYPTPRPPVEMRAAPAPTEFQREAARRIEEPGALTARTIEILRTQVQEVQKREEVIAKEKMAAGAPMPTTEYTQHIIRESPEAQKRLAELQKQKKQWWEFWR